MPDPVWSPSVDDTELDGLSAQLRAAVRSALPDLVANEQRAAGTRRARHVEIRQAPGLTLRLEVTKMRSIVLDRRPVLEVRFRGTVRSPDRADGRPVELPIEGECRLDINSGAIVHLNL